VAVVESSVILHNRYCEKMEEEKVMSAIVVVQEGITAFAKQVGASARTGTLFDTLRQALAEFQARYHIEQFLEVELLVNITQHELVPLHVPLNNTEKAQLLAR
jgi:DNA-directed RNA polymerase I, II, and III subunit RPABC1